MTEPKEAEPAPRESTAVPEPVAVPKPRAVPLALPVAPPFAPPGRPPVGPPTVPSWPLRERAARPVVFAALTAAVVAPITVPLDRPGLGWLVTGAAVTAGLAAVATSLRVRPGQGGDDSGHGRAAADAGPAPGAGLGPGNVAWAVATLALLGVGALRAAEWLFALCVLAAGFTAAQAVGRGRTPLGLFFAAVCPPVAAARGLAWLGRAGAEARTSVAGRRGSALRTAVTVAITLLLLLVFGALFAGADPAFSRVIGAIVPDVGAMSVVRAILLFPTTAAVVLAGAFLLVNPTRFGDLRLPPPRTLRRIEWALPVAALDALFLLFLGVQLTVLFGDDEYVRRTAGLTFAEYARGGFWQLLVVTMLTLLVLAVAVRKAPREGGGDRTLLRVLLGTLAGCAVLVVASALWRMWLYEQAYGFTRLRVVVSAFELWLGLLFVLVLAAGVRLRAAWLPRAVTGVGVAVLLALALLDPDRFVAARNIDRYHDKQVIDVWYLQELSADAAVELDRLPSPLRECALSEMADRVHRRDGWTEYNAGRAAARRVRLPEPSPWQSTCDDLGPRDYDR